MLSYSIIGMGAIGGYYGGRLAEAKKVGFDMPKLAMLEAELKFIEAQLNS